MVDPVTLEIINNRLQQIGLQGGYTLINTAASPGVVHAKDLGFNISDHLGRCIVYSMWMPRHGTTLSYMLRACQRKFEGRIRPGDMFITNNPHDGALHNLDIAILAPVHYQGELIAWTGCATHHLDVGAMTPGRAPQATEYLQEGIIIPPLKIVEDFELKQEIFDLFLENVRVPHYQGLDLKGQIASNNVARDKMLELAARYGVKTLKSCYEEIISFSEEKTRRRIRLLPKGRYEAIDYVSYDKIYTIKCTLIVEDESLTFDFAGTDPQAPNFINSALPCTVANVHNIVVCLLTPDIPVNEGCLRPIKVVAPEMSIVNCKPPAPCSGASVISGWNAMSLAVRTLSLALDKSAESWRSNASWPSGQIDTLLTGKDRKGKPFFARNLGGGAMGGGARANKDGLNFGSAPGSTTTSHANAEAGEARFPVLTLYTRAIADSGGAGKFRGGTSSETAFKLHNAAQAEALFWWTGKGVAANGFKGGHPGSNSCLKIKENSDVMELLPKSSISWEKLKGVEKDLPGRYPTFVLKEKDVVLRKSAGGGGCGNPIDRDPLKVLEDVKEGYVSIEKAASDYGVLIDSREMDLNLAGTEKLRASMRRLKKGKAGLRSDKDSQAGVLTDRRRSKHEKLHGHRQTPAKKGRVGKSDR
ncbi:MAG: hydantoinase B/oxoprolinase family protein [Desulfobacterales bacterium]|nr:hydantoinase B/oxoprolinase family protein [Desulfobacterales bacterium]